MYVEDADAAGRQCSRSVPGGAAFWGWGARDGGQGQSPTGGPVPRRTSETTISKASTRGVVPGEHPGRALDERSEAGPGPCKGGRQMASRIEICIVPKEGLERKGRGSLALAGVPSLRCTRALVFPGRVPFKGPSWRAGEGKCAKPDSFRLQRDNQRGYSEGREAVRVGRGQSPLLNRWCRRRDSNPHILADTGF